MRRFGGLHPYVIAARNALHRKWTPTDLAWGNVSFSQFGEDIFLSHFFAAQRSGFYVDVGALHPAHMSNTLLLYRAGWRGINIEPDPEGVRLFRRYRPRDINLELAISSDEGAADFVVAGAFSGLKGSTYLWGTARSRVIQVTTRRLASVLDEYLPEKTEIDFLCVDCEGHDREILLSNDWQRYRPRLVAAEAHSECFRDIPALLASVGYEPVVQLRLTHFYERVDA
jgi:FkbM family methyltransferase